MNERIPLPTAASTSLLRLLYIVAVAIILRHSPRGDSRLEYLLDRPEMKARLDKVTLSALQGRFKPRVAVSKLKGLRLIKVSRVIPAVLLHRHDRRVRVFFFPIISRNSRLTAYYARRRLFTTATTTTTAMRFTFIPFR